jgi:hypothetical protein
MALETGTWVDDLVITNPTSGDPKSQGDDHLRLIKTVLKNTFPLATAAMYPLQAATAQATTAGSAFEFTSIPSWVKEIDILFSGVSSTGSTVMLAQLGDSGGYETTVYAGSLGVVTNGAATVAQTSTTGFQLAQPSGAEAVSGVAHLRLVSGTTWVFSVAGGYSNASAAFSGGGTKTLSATLDRLRLSLAAGTFDAGSVNIIYRG